jgi:hypothetical protein
MLSALVVVGAAVRLRDAVGMRADSSTLRALVVVGVTRGNDEGDADTVRITLGLVADGADLVGIDSDDSDDDVVDEVSGDNGYVVSAEYKTLNALVVVAVVAGRYCDGSDDVSSAEDVMFSVLVVDGNDDSVGSNAEYSTLKALVVVGDGNDEHDEEYRDCDFTRADD